MSRPTTPPAAWMTERNLALARTLWDEGVLTTEIGRRVGCSKHAVVGFAHRNGWPPRPSPLGRRKGEVREAVPRLPDKPHRRPQEGEVRRASPKTLPAPRAACNPLPLAAPTVVFRHCQWTDSPGRPWRFCGAPATRGAWCAEHHARAYTRSPRQELVAA